jgi:toxin FitB
MAAVWLLDTCVVSEMTAPSPSASVLQWIQMHAGQSALSAVTLGEIQYGIASLDAGAKQRRLAIWFEGMLRQFHDRILVSSTEIWLEFGRLKRELEKLGRPQDDLDILIAATAHCHRLKIATRNVRHFADTGLEVFNPWK